MSKVFECVILPIASVEYCNASQIGLSKSLGCQYTHRIMSKILVDMQSKNDSLLLRAVDISKAFDSVNYLQAIASLINRSV